MLGGDDDGKTVVVGVPDVAGVVTDVNAVVALIIAAGDVDNVVKLKYLVTVGPVGSAVQDDDGDED